MIKKARHNFRELNIWKDALAISKELFPIVQGFPNHERYNLSSQIMRCAISVPSNIAEGSSRDSVKEFNHFLNIALGSSYELETQLILANEFNYIDKEKFDTILVMLTKNQKMIYQFQKTILNQSTQTKESITHHT